MDARTFIDNFGTLAETPGGVKKLRELILQMAVRGQLVEQDPDDEPASELLKKIEAEKARLMKAGKVKVDKPLPPVDSGEELYELPAGWEWTRLGTIASHNAGKTLDNGRNTGELRDYITTSNLYWRNFILDDLKQMRIEISELDRCTAEKGDLLVCEGGEAGRAAVWQRDSSICFQNHIHRVRFYGGISAYYVCRLFEKINYTGEINNFRKGVAISNMSGAALASIPIPLPPLAEQHRIVAKVDELMGLCDELEARQREREEARPKLRKACFAALTDDGGRAAISRVRAHMPSLCDTPDSVADLRQTILQLAVMGRLVPQDPSDEPASELLKKIAAEKARLVKEGKIKKDKPLPPVDQGEVPHELPQWWEWARLGSLNFSFQNGLSKRSGASGVDTVVLRLADIAGGRVSTSNCRLIRLTAVERERYSVKECDILVTRVNGSIDLVGSFNLVTQSQGQGYCDHFVRMRSPHNFVNMPYMELYGRSRLCRDQIEAKFITTAGQKTVNQGHLASLSFPLPPLAEQHRIVAKVDSLMALCDELEAKLKQSHADGDKLMASIVNSLVEAA